MLELDKDTITYVNNIGLQTIDYIAATNNSTVFKIFLSNANKEILASIYKFYDSIKIDVAKLRTIAEFVDASRITVHFFDMFISKRMLDVIHILSSKVSSDFLDNMCSVPEFHGKTLNQAIQQIYFEYFTSTTLPSAPPLILDSSSKIERLDESASAPPFMPEKEMTGCACATVDCVCGKKAREMAGCACATVECVCGKGGREGEREGERKIETTLKILMTESSSGEIYATMVEKTKEECMVCLEELDGDMIVLSCDKEGRHRICRECDRKIKLSDM